MNAVNANCKQKSSTENVQVFLRMRPFNKREIERNEMSIWTIGKNYLKLNSERFNSLLKQHKICSAPYTRPCVFNGCFDNTSTSAEIYGSTLRTLVDGSLNGINGTLFLYGQTGSGKTYTMMGDYNEETLGAKDSGSSRGRRTPVKDSVTPRIIERAKTPLKKVSRQSQLKALDGDMNEGVLVLSLKDIFSQIGHVICTQTVEQEREERVLREMFLHRDIQRHYL